MSIRSTMKGDSFSSAHTWRTKCSFVIDIIQHVEYSVPMARVAEIAQTTPPHTGETCLRQQSRVTLSSADSSSVRRDESNHAAALQFQCSESLQKNFITHNFHQQKPFNTRVSRILFRRTKSQMVIIHKYITIIAFN